MVSWGEVEDLHIYTSSPQRARSAVGNSFPETSTRRVLGGKGLRCGLEGLQIFKEIQVSEK
jgi:hypothetical protein